MGPGRGPDRRRRTGRSEFLGLPPAAEVTFDRFLETVLVDDPPRIRQRLTEALATAGDYEVEFRTFWPDGSLHWILLRGRSYHGDGKPLRIMGSTIDVTERRHAEEELKADQDAAERRIPSPSTPAAPRTISSRCSAVGSATR